MTSAVALTLEASAGASRTGAGRRAAQRVRLGGGEADDDRVSGLDLAGDDLGEPPVGDPGLDLDRLGIPLDSRRLVDGRRSLRSLAAAPAAGAPSAASGTASASRTRPA